MLIVENNSCISSALILILPTRRHAAPRRSTVHLGSREGDTDDGGGEGIHAGAGGRRLGTVRQHLAGHAARAAGGVRLGRRGAGALAARLRRGPALRVRCPVQRLRVLVAGRQGGVRRVGPPRPRDDPAGAVPVGPALGPATPAGVGRGSPRWGRRGVRRRARPADARDRDGGRRLGGGGLVQDPHPHAAAGAEPSSWTSAWCTWCATAVVWRSRTRSTS